tara:strand:- start:1447 stop:10029 length:8583 start_codon:yes stop_codon:yes gene_type:complete
MTYTHDTVNWARKGGVLFGGENVSSVAINNTANLLAYGVHTGPNTSVVKIYSMDSSFNWVALTDIIDTIDNGFGNVIKFDDTGSIIAISSPFADTSGIVNSGLVTTYEYDNAILLAGGSRTGQSPLRGTGGTQGIASSSNNSSSDTERIARHAFTGRSYVNNNKKNNHHCWLNATDLANGNEAWLKFEFPSPEIVNEYQIFPTQSNKHWTILFDYMPTDFIFQASHDDSTWVDLDSRTGQVIPDITALGSEYIDRGWIRTLNNNTEPWQDATRLKYQISNGTAYKYYRLFITKTRGQNNTYNPNGHNIAVGELLLSYNQMSPGGTWSIKGNPIQSLNIQENGGFGSKSIDFNSTGSRIAIGEPHLSNNATGTIYVFDFIVDWTPVGFPIIGGTNENLGDSVLLTGDGNRVAAAGAGIGANKVRIFDISNNVFTNTVSFNGESNCKIGENNSLAISANGDTIAYAGRHFNNNIGYVEVKKHSDRGWKRKGQQIFGEIDRHNNGHDLGLNGLELSSDGNRLVISCSNYNRIGKVKIYDYNTNSGKWVYVSTIYSSNKEWFPAALDGGYGKFGYGLSCNNSATTIAICGSGIKGDLSDNTIPIGVIEMFDQVSAGFNVIPHSINNKLNYPTYKIESTSTSTRLSHLAQFNEDTNELGGVDASGAGGDKTTNDTYIGFISQKSYILTSLESGFEVNVAINNCRDANIIMAFHHNNDPNYYYPGHDFFTHDSDISGNFDLVVNITNNVLTIPNRDVNLDLDGFVLRAGGGSLDGTGGSQGIASASQNSDFAHLLFDTSIGDEIGGSSGPPDPFPEEGGTWYYEYLNNEPDPWFQFEFPEPQTINMYRLFTPNHASAGHNPSRPGEMKVEGSHDGTFFFEVYNQHDVSIPHHNTEYPRLDSITNPYSPDGPRHVDTYFSNKTAYTYYRFTILDNVQNKSWGILGGVALYSDELQYMIDVSNSSSMLNANEYKSVDLDKPIQLVKDADINNFLLYYHNTNNEYKFETIIYPITPDVSLNSVTTGGVRYIKLLMSGGENINVDRGYMHQSSIAQNADNNTGTTTNGTNQYIISRFILHVNNSEYLLPDTVTYNTNFPSISDPTTLNDIQTILNDNASNENSKWANVTKHGETKYIGGGAGVGLEHWTLIELNEEEDVPLETFNAIFIEPGNGKGHSDMAPTSSPSVYDGLDQSMNFIRGLQVQLLDSSQRILNSVTIPKSYRLDAYSNTDPRSITIEYTKGYSSSASNDLDPTVRTDPLIIDAFDITTKNADDPKYFITSFTRQEGLRIPTNISVHELPGIIQPRITQLQSSFTPNAITRSCSLYLNQNINKHTYVINDIPAIDILDNNLNAHIPPVLISNTTGVRTILRAEDLSYNNPIQLSPGFYTIYFNDNAYSDMNDIYSLDISFTILINYIDPSFVGDLPNITAETPYHIIDISSALTFSPFSINDLSISVNSDIQSLNIGSNYSHLHSSIIAEAGGGSYLDGTGGDKGIATASTLWNSYSVRGKAHFAFNGKLSTYTDSSTFNDSNSWLSSDQNIDQWLQFEFPTNTVITMYRIWTRNSFYNNPPKTWTIEGCLNENDYSVDIWYTLDNQSNITDWPIMSSATDNSIYNTSNMKEFHISNVQSYKYYRLTITDTTPVDGWVNGNRELYKSKSIGELALYSTKILPEIIYTTNGNFIVNLKTPTLQAGLGSRNGTGEDEGIVETSSSLYGTSTPLNIFNGTNTSTSDLLAFDSVATTTGGMFVTPILVKFTFPVYEDIAITSYRMWRPIEGVYDSRAGLPRGWRFEGSNDDLSWNILDTQTNVVEYIGELGENNTDGVEITQSMNQLTTVVVLPTEGEHWQCPPTITQNPIGSYTISNHTIHNREFMNTSKYFQFNNTTSYKHYRFVFTHVHWEHSISTRLYIGNIALYSSENKFMNIPVKDVPSFPIRLQFDISYNIFNTKIVKELNIINQHNIPIITPPQSSTINKQFGDSLEYLITHTDTSFADLSYNVSKNTFSGDISSELHYVDDLIQMGAGGLDGTDTSHGTVSHSSKLFVPLAGGGGLFGTGGDQGTATASSYALPKAEAGAGGLNGTGGEEGVASASTQDQNQSPTKAFNNSLDTDDYWMADDDDQKTSWLKFQFPTPKKITLYKIWLRFKLDSDVSYAKAPSSWEFQGSNDDQNWTTLHSQSHVVDGTIFSHVVGNTIVNVYESYHTIKNFASSYNILPNTHPENDIETSEWKFPTSSSAIANDEQRNEYRFSNNNSYLYYRLYLTALNSTDYLYTIGELGLYSFLEPWPVPTIEAGAGGLNGTGGEEGVATDSRETTSAIKAFDNTLVNRFDYWDPRAKPAWLMFAFPTPKIITLYRIWGRYDENTIPSGSWWSSSTISDDGTHIYPGHGTGRYPNTWQLLGSNDETTWTTLHSQSNINEWPQVLDSNAIQQGMYYKEFTFTNNTAYVYYKLYITAINENDSLVSIGQLGLYSIDKINKDAPSAFNNITNPSEDSWVVENNNQEEWLKFEFPTATLIDCYRISTRESNTPKTWQLESSDDNSNWNILDTQTNITDWDNFNEYSISNYTPYKYYKLRISETNHSDYTYISQLGLGKTYIPSLAFNGTLENENDAWISDGLNDTEWLKVEFTIKRAINMYRIWPRNSSTSAPPKSWTFEGSNDDVIWDTLDIRKNIIDWEYPNSDSITNLTKMKEYHISNDTRYSYYRILISEHVKEYISVNELANVSWTEHTTSVNSVLEAFYLAREYDAIGFFESNPNQYHWLKAAEGGGSTYTAHNTLGVWMVTPTTVAIGEFALYENRPDTSILKLYFSTNITDRTHYDFTVNAIDISTNTTVSLTNTVHLDRPYTNIDASYNYVKMTYDLDLPAMAYQFI